MQGGDAPRPRDRIVATARELFRERGVRGVGVDAIAERAGTNKMTLYRHFGSKGDLVVACLRGYAAEFEEVWLRIERSAPGDPAGQLRAWVRGAAEYAAGDGRCCEISNIAVELAGEDHPARAVIEELKLAHRDRLAILCRAAGIAEADLLADTLTMLLEGARVSRQCAAGSEGPSARFQRAAEAVLQAFAADAGTSLPPVTPLRPPARPSPPSPGPSPRSS